MKPTVFISFFLLVNSLLTACNPNSPVFETTITPSSEAPPLASPTSDLLPEVTNTPTETLPPTSPLGVDVTALSGTQVEMWHAWPGSTGESIQALTDEFNAENPWGIQATAFYQGTYDELTAKVNQGIETGALPEIVTGYHYRARAWETLQPMVNLNDYVNDPVWGFSKEEQADFIPVFWEYDLINSKRLGLPAQRSAQFLFYNLTWARELGFDQPPASPEEFTLQACAAAKTKKEDDDPLNDHTGGWIISSHYPVVLGWIDAFGGKIIDEQGKVGTTSPYQFDTPEVQDTFSFLRQLYDDGCAWLTSSVYPEADFAGRQGLFSTGSVMDVPYQNEAFTLAKNGDQWTVLPFPSPSQQPAINGYGPSYILLPSSPAEQLAGWLYLKWLLSPDNQVRLVQTSGSLPLQSSVVESLAAYRATNPQWAAALESLPYIKAEPADLSWNLVRWSLSDAATQLFRDYFTIEQIPNLAAYLDRQATSLHESALGAAEAAKEITPEGPPPGAATHTPTITPTLTPTPTRER